MHFVNRRQKDMDINGNGTERQAENNYNFCQYN